MKKLMVIVLSLAMVLSLAACGSKPTTPAGSADASVTEEVMPYGADDSLSVDVLSAFGDQMGDAAAYIDAMTMTFYFENNEVVGIDEIVTCTDKVTDEELAGLETSLAGQGAVTVDGKVVTISIEDISTYAGMDKDTIQSTLEAAGLTVLD